MTLTEFLLARIAEDESQAGWQHRLLCLRIGCEVCVFEDDGDIIAAERVCTCGYPARVLAECAAKRVWVSEYEQWSAAPGPQVPIIWAALRGPMHHLAAIYADHPDYRQEWKP